LASKHKFEANYEAVLGSFIQILLAFFSTLIIKRNNYVAYQTISVFSPKLYSNPMIQIHQ